MSRPSRIRDTRAASWRQSAVAHLQPHTDRRFRQHRGMVLLAPPAQCPWLDWVYEWLLCRLATLVLALQAVIPFDLSIGITHQQGQRLVGRAVEFGRNVTVLTKKRARQPARYRLKWPHPPGRPIDAIVDLGRRLVEGRGCGQDAY